MPNASDYLWDFHFTLTEECSFPKIKGPAGIQLLPGNDSSDGTKTVNAFIVRVKFPTEEKAHEAADRRAKKLVDILAVLSVKYLGYTLIGHKMYKPGGRNELTSLIRFRYDINISPKPADLSQGNLPTIINTPKLKGRNQVLVDRLNK
jgi:hypothetical protein